jgi:copper(I)-binding protein
MHRILLAAILATAVLAAADPPAITLAWARATAPTAQAAGLFCTITGGSTADVLMAGSCANATAVELHTVSADASGVRRMHQVPAIDIPAGVPVVLRPGSLHIMLLGLKAPLAIGDRVAFTLRFRDGGAVEATAIVGEPGAMGPAAGPATAAR